MSPPNAEGDGLVSIYALVDPRDSCVRYVGRTKDLARRTRQHWNGRHSCLPLEPFKNAWLLDLEAMDLEPRVVELDRVPYGNQWAEELRWMARWWQAGAGLFNDRKDLAVAVSCN